MADEPKIVASLSDASIKQFDKLIAALERTDAAFDAMIKAFNKTLDEFEKLAKATEDTSFNFQKIRVDLSKLVTSMERVSTAMTRITGGTYTLAGQLNKLVQPTAALNKLGQALDSFSLNAAGNLENLRQLLQAMAQLQSLSLAAAQNAAQKQNNNVEIVSLEKVVQTVRSLKDLSAGLYNLSSAGVLERVRSFGDDITEVFTKFIGKGFSDSMRMSVNALSNFMRSYAEFTDLLRGNSSFEKGLDAVTRVIKEFIENLNTGPDIQRFLGPGVSTTLNSIADVLKSFTRITRAVKDSGETFNKTAEMGIMSVLTFIKRFMFEFSQTSTELDGNNIQFAQVKEQIAEIEPIMRLLIGFTEQYVKLGSKRIDPQSVSTLPTALMQFTSALMNSMNVFQTFQTNAPQFNIDASLRTIQTYLVIINKLFRIIDQFKTFTDVESPNLVDFSKFTPFLESFKTNVLDVLQRFILAFSGLGEGRKIKDTAYGEIVASVRAIFAIRNNIVKSFRKESSTEGFPQFEALLTTFDSQVFTPLLNFIRQVPRRVSGMDFMTAVRNVQGALKSVQAIGKMLELVHQYRTAETMGGQNVKSLATKLLQTELGVRLVLLPVVRIVRSIAKVGASGGTRREKGALHRVAQDMADVVRVIERLPVLLAWLNKASISSFTFDTAKQMAFDSLRVAIQAVFKIALPLRGLAKMLPKLPPQAVESIKAISSFMSALTQLSKQEPAYIKQNAEIAIQTVKKLAKHLIDFKVVTSSGTLQKLPSAIANINRPLKSTLNLFGSLGVGGVNAIQKLISTFGSFFSSVGRGINNIFRLNFGLNEMTRSLQMLAQDLQRISLDKLYNAQFTTIASDFEDLQYQLRIFGGMNEEALKDAEAFADYIGINYPISANEAMAAILDLIKTGASLEEIKGILPSAADISALSGGTRDIGQSTEFLIAAMKGYRRIDNELGVGFGVQQTKRVADLIFRISNATISTMDDLQLGLQRFAPAANVFNQSIETASILLSQLNTAQVKGVEAGTMLRSALVGLFSKQGLKTLERLDINPFTENGGLRDAIDVLLELKTVLDTLNDKSRVETIRGLGDVYAQQGLNILLASKDLEKLREIKNEGMSASEGAQELMQSFKGVVLQAKGTLETLYKDVFYPIIVEVFKPLAEQIFNLLKYIKNLSPQVHRFIGQSVLLGSALSTVLLVVTTLGSKFVMITSATISLGFVLGGLGTAFLGIATSVGTTSQAVTTLWQTIEDFGLRAVVSFGPLVQSVKDLATYLQNMTQQKPNVQSLGNIFQQLGANAILGLQNLFNIDYSRTLYRLTQESTDLIETLGVFVNETLAHVFGKIDVNWILRAVRNVLDSLQTFVLNALGLDTVTVQKIKTTILNVFDAVVDFFSNTVAPVAEGVINVLQELADPLVNVYNQVIGTITRVRVAIGYYLQQSGLAQTLTDRITTIGNFFSNLGTLLKDVINNYLLPFLVTTEKFLLDVVTFFGNIFLFIDKVLNNQVNWDVFRRGVFYFLRKVAQDVEQFFKNLVASLEEQLLDLPNKVNAIAPGIFTMVFNIVKAIPEAIGNLIFNIPFFLRIGGAILTIFSRILEGLAATVHEFFRVLVENVATNNPVLDFVFKTIFRIVGTVMPMLLETFGMLTKLANVFITSIANVVDAILHFSIGGIIQSIGTLFAQLSPIFAVGYAAIFGVTALFTKLGAIFKGLISIGGLVLRPFTMLFSWLRMVVTAGNPLMALLGSLGGAFKFVSGIVGKFFAPLRNLVLAFAAIRAVVRGLTEMFKTNIFSGLMEALFTFGETVIKMSGLEGIIDLKAARQSLDLLKMTMNGFINWLGNKFQMFLLDLEARFTDIRYAIQQAINSVLGREDVQAKVYLETRETIDVSLEALKKDNLTMPDIEKEALTLLRQLAALSEVDPNAANNLIRLNSEAFYEIFKKSYDLAGKRVTPLMNKFANEFNLLDFIFNALNNGQMYDEQTVYDLLFTSEFKESIEKGTTEITDSQRQAAKKILRSRNFVQNKLRRNKIRDLQTVLEVAGIDPQDTDEDVQSFMRSLDELGYTIYNNQIVTREFAAEQSKLAHNLRQSLGKDVGNIFADLDTQIKTTNKTGQEWLQTLRDIANTLNTMVKSSTETRLSQLNRDFMDGVITANAYRQQVASALQQADKTLKDNDKNLRDRITTLFMTGKLTGEQMSEALGELDQELAKTRKNNDAYTQIVEVQIKLKNKKLTPEAARAEIDAILKKVFGEQTSEFSYGVDISAAPEWTGTIDTELANALAAQGQVELPSPQEIKSIEKEIEQLDKNIVRSNDKLADEEKKFLRQRYEDTLDFHRDLEKAEREHERRLLEIDEEGSEALIQAVAQRDSAAAQQAVKARLEERKKEKETYELKKKEREEDFLFQQERKRREHQNRIEDLQAEIAATRAERDEKKRALEEQLALARQTEKEKTKIEVEEARKRLEAFRNSSTAISETLNGLLNAAVDGYRAISPAMSDNVRSIANGLITIVGGLGTLTNYFKSANQPPLLPAPTGTPKTAWQNALSVLGTPQGPAPKPTLSKATSNNGLFGVLNNLAQTARPALSKATITQRGGGVGALARANGGPVSPNTLYRVGEREPELFRQSGKLYLIPSERGNVIPPREFGKRPMPLQPVSRSIAVNVGGIHIEASSAMNTDDLIRKVETVVIPKITKAVQKVSQS